MKTDVFLPHWHAASEETVTDGLDWYPRAEVIVRRWSRIYNRHPHIVAGIIAVLSQRQRWQFNLLQAERCLQGFTPKGLKLAVIKALRLYDHDLERLSVIKGPKVEAFHKAILGNMDSVVLDSHMIRAAYPDKRSLSVKQYEALADVLREEAASVGVPPAHFQAVVWCQIRGRAD